MSNPDFVVSQPAESTKKTKKETEEENRSKQLFRLGKRIAAHFNIRALNVFETKSSTKIFVLTGSHFLLIKLSDTKTVSLFKWSSIEKFNIPEKKNEIQFTFRPEKRIAAAEGYVVRTDKLDFNLSFDKDKFDSIASEIIDVLERVLTEAELTRISIISLKPPLVAITSKSALCRLKMGSQGKPSRFSQNTIQLMTQIIQVGIPHVDLSQFEDISIFLTTFFDCVTFIRTLRSIEIPQIAKLDVCPLVAKLLKQKSTLKSISIQGKYNFKDINTLAEAIKNNQSLKLRGIEFGLSSFGTRELNIISDLLNHTNINTLGLHDAFQSEKEACYFYNSFLVPSITQNLYCLNLSKTPNVDIEKLFPKLSKVRFLSLACCGLEIIDVFSKLSLIAMSRLKEIDLSGNRVGADKYLDENIRLPQFLTSLILNNLSWPVDTFRLFIYQIFKHIPTNLKLSLSNSIMDQNEWYKVFDSLENPNENGGFYGLSVLVWDYNPLHKKFFSFLRRNKSLTRLQMNYCFRNSTDQSGVFDKLKDYLAGARNLKTLIIRGDDENNFGENTPRLIEVIKSMSYLEQLDILNSHGGVDSLQPIQELCNKNKNLKINFDGLFPDDFEKYSEAYTNLVSIRPPPNLEAADAENNENITHQPSLFRISFPFNDMQYLINTNKIKESDVRHFEEQFFYSPEEEAARINRVEAKNKNKKGRRFKPVPTSEIAQPGNLYAFNADEGFPRYIDEEVVDQFRKDIQTISYNGKPEDEVNINDEAFRSMILSSRKFSRLSQSSPTKENSEFSPQPSPLSVRQRGIRQRETESETDEDEEENEIVNSDIGSLEIENSDDQNSDDQNSEDDEDDNNNSNNSEKSDEQNSNSQTGDDDEDSDEKVVATPKNAQVNDNQSINSSDNNESESAKRTDNNSEDDDEGDDDQDLEFDIPQLVDVKKYNYAGWKELDKNYTLQNLYSQMTQSRNLSESISTRSSSRPRSKK